MTDHRDELIETQRKLIASQEGVIATLRAMLAGSQMKVREQAQLIEVLKAQTPRKDVQA